MKIWILLDTKNDDKEVTRRTSKIKPKIAGTRYQWVSLESLVADLKVPKERYVRETDGDLEGEILFATNAT